MIAAFFFAVSPTNAAEYMPPPLFGGPPTVTVTPSPDQSAPAVSESPAPHTQTLPVPHIDDAQNKIVVPTPPPGVKGDIPLPPNVLEHDAVIKPTATKKTEPAKDPDITVGTSAAATVSPKPFGTDDLINHPANYVDPLVKKSGRTAQTAKSEPSVIPALSSPVVDKTVPATMPPEPMRKTPAGLARPIVDGPGVKNIRPKDQPKKIVAVKPTAEPKPVDVVPNASDMTLIDQAPDVKVLPSKIILPNGQRFENANKTNPPQPVTPSTPESITTPKTVSKPGIKSPSPTVRKIIEQNPKVMVYSRDKETGEFKRVENSEHRILLNKGHKTTLSTPKDSDIPPPAFIDDVMDTVQKSKTTEPKKTAEKIRPVTPPLPASVSPLSMNDALNGRLVPLTEEDLNRAVVSMTPNEPFGKVPNTPNIPDVQSSQKGDMLYATKVKEPAQPASSGDVSSTRLPKDSGSDLSAATPVTQKNVTPMAMPSSSLPPATTDGPATITFTPNAIELSPAQRSQIDDMALIPLSKNKNNRVDIRSYASPVPNEQNSDRRIALARGLAVREYLKTQGIAPDRIELKVLGSPVDQTPADRVDLIVR